MRSVRTRSSVWLRVVDIVVRGPRLRVAYLRTHDSPCLVLGHGTADRHTNRLSYEAVGGVAVMGVETANRPPSVLVWRYMVDWR